jgi:hypothetical protein
VIRAVALVPALALALLATSCSTPASGVKTQQYAALRDERVFEFDLPATWKGIEKALGNFKVVDRDPEEVSALEWKDLEERSLETDWIYSQSRDKYVEYRVNDSPRRKYPQIRYRFKLVAKRAVAGTSVKIDQDEEIERLKPNGMADGYDSTTPDRTRASEFLDRIQQAILSAAP